MSSRARWWSVVLLPLLLVAGVAIAVFRADGTRGANAALGSARGDVGSRRSAGNAVVPNPEVAEPDAESVPQTEVVPAGGRVALSPSVATLIVEVAAEEDGRRLEEIFVEVVDGIGNRAARGRRTDAEGLATLEVVPEADLSVRACSASVGPPLPPRPEYLRVPALTFGERRRVSIPLRTTPDAVLEGRVVDRATKVPITGARVTLHVGSMSFGDGRRPVPIPRTRPASPVLARALTDSDGAFALVTGSWITGSVRIEAHGYSVGSVGLQTFRPAWTKRTIRLERAARLVVTVLGAGRVPKVAASVRIEAVTGREANPHDAAPSVAWSATSGPDGTATFDDLPAGFPLVVEISDSKRKLRLEPTDLVLEPGEIREEAFLFAGLASVLGRLVDSEGTPLAGETVWIAPAREGHAARFEPMDPFDAAVTDELGCFLFSEVPAGDWWIGPAAHTMRLRRKEIPNRLAPDAELVSVPESGSVSVTVRTDRGLAIEGRVLYEGKPVGRAVVRAVRRGETHGTSVKSDGDGAFLLGPLVDGEYELTAEFQLNRTRMVAEQVIARAGEDEVVLTLERAPHPR